MYKLNPEKQISVNKEVITKILGRYSIYNFTFNPVNQGITNTSFVIESLNKKYLLRIYAQGKNTEEILLEIKFQDYLRENNVPIPLIYKNISEEELLIIEIDGKDWQCILMQFVEGKSVTEEPDLELISELAQIQARIHNLGIEFGNTQEKPNKILTNLRNSVEEKFKDISLQKQEIFDFIERARNYNYHLDENLPYGYNHLDIDFDGNVLVKDNKITAILDFDDLKYSPAVVCLGYSLWNILDDEGLDSMKYYLNEYQKVRSLNNLELESLRHIILFRNYQIGLIRLILWEENTPIKNIENLIVLEKEIPFLVL